MFDTRSIPIARIKHKRIITFSLPVERPNTHNRSRDNFKSGVIRQAYKDGTLSHGARKRLQRSIELLIDISPKTTFTHPTLQKEFPFQLAFLTLTLSAPQGSITDKKVVAECLQPFLQILRRKYKCKSYVWRAEKQKNGNIHFHITTNQYLAYDQIRDDWNKCQQHLLFIDTFEQKYEHRNPNSTDIHSVRKVKDLARYLIKYMSKGDSNSKPVGCKLWDCSLNLKIRDNVDIILDSDNCSLLQDLINNTGVTRFIGDCFECYQMRGFDIRSIMPSAWKDLYMQFLNRVRSFVDTVTDVGPQVSSVL